MSSVWPAKRADETVLREWPLPLTDAAASVSATATGATVGVCYIADGSAWATLSGGANGTPATITVTATTAGGQTLVHTFTMAVQSDAAAFGYTASSLVTSALRKITGFGVSPDTDQAAFGLECLNDMLAEWRGRGMDLGCALPLLSAASVPVPDAFISAIKTNLALVTADQFGREVTPTLQRQAAIGLELIKQTLAPKKRPEFF